MTTKKKNQSEVMVLTEALAKAIQDNHALEKRIMAVELCIDELKRRLLAEAAYAGTIGKKQPVPSSHYGDWEEWCRLSKSRGEYLMEGSNMPPGGCGTPFMK